MYTMKRIHSNEKQRIMVEDKSADTNKPPCFIYVIWEREFMNQNDPVYKIGITERMISSRLNQYPKSSGLLYCEPVPDRKLEAKVLSVLREKLNQRKDIGSEYFQGDLTQIITMIKHVVSIRMDIYTYPPAPPAPNEKNAQKETQRRARAKKPNYYCPRCGYNTEQKGHMKKHLFDNKNECQGVLNDVFLTDEIKNLIIKNRIYKIEKKDDYRESNSNKILNQTINQYNTINNMIT